ncbi:MAG TPA: hypothetical protein VHV75_08765 [Solirubrobacteraceae bacterium]|jgi:hypothetical protein|nr:hypothetical protein [Solirubrobacteraceae bacterium]
MTDHAVNVSVWTLKDRLAWSITRIDATERVRDEQPREGLT